MFVRQRRQSGLSRAIGLAEVMYHATVRGVRGRHGSALISLLMSVLQTVILVGAFWLMISLMGIRSFAIRGDFVLYLFSGIFLFMTHTNASSAVFSAEGPTSAMMLHSPMNTIVATPNNPVTGCTPNNQATPRMTSTCNDVMVVTKMTRLRITDVR